MLNKEDATVVKRVAAPHLLAVVADGRMHQELRVFLTRRDGPTSPHWPVDWRGLCYNQRGDSLYRMLT